MQQELDEFHNDPVRMQQAQLDTWWESQLDLEFEEADMYEVGGYIEYHSRTPSFHKSRRESPQFTVPQGQNGSCQSQCCSFTAPH
jgi:hypothetical protein